MKATHYIIPKPSDLGFRRCIRKIHVEAAPDFGRNPLYNVSFP